MSNEELMWIGIPALVVSIVANSILNLQSRGKQGFGRSGNFVMFCYMLFAGCLFIGWKLFGWLGVGGALVVQIVGMVVGVSLLKGRVASVLALLALSQALLGQSPADTARAAQKAGDTTRPAQAPTTPAIDSVQPPASGPASLTVTAEPALSVIGQNLTVRWQSTAATAKLAVEYSANDGRSWKPWSEITTNGAASGSISVPVGWKQFNFLYFSYGKFRLFTGGQKGADKFARFLGNPLRVRLVDPARKDVTAAEVKDLWVKGPPWIMALYLGTFVFAALFFYQKARWEQTPRGEVSLLFNLLCFACLAAKVTFFFAFALYLIVGMGVGHRFTIIKNGLHAKYGLATFYQYFYIVVAAIALLTLIVGLVMRVRDLLF